MFKHKNAVFAELPAPAQRDWNKKGQSWMNFAQTKLTSFCWLLTISAGLFVVVFHFGHNGSFYASDEMLHAEHVVSEAAHMLAIRGECNETSPVLESAVDGITALGFSGSITASRLGTEGTQVATAASADSISEPVGESVPVSTHTSLSTIYGVKSTAGGRTLTSTTTGTKTITILPVPEYTYSAEDACQRTITETVLVTVYPPSDATVTAQASTVTDLNTHLTYTSRLPDVTLSGNPSTYTDIHTDVSYTSGAPDATVPGSPSTVTNLQTDVSVTTGLPDATLSGDASTVTEIQIWPLTTTYSTAFTTITVTDLWDTNYPPPASQTQSEFVSLSTLTTIISPRVTITIYPSSSSSSSSTPGFSSEVAGDVTTLPANPTSTYTTTVTATAGTPAVETTTVDVVPPPAYTSSAYNSSEGDVSSTTSPHAPIVISGGSKRPELNAWGTSNGGGHMACILMLVAVITLTL